jgi:hypothetical protein
MTLTKDRSELAQVKKREVCHTEKCISMILSFLIGSVASGNFTLQIKRMKIRIKRVL